MFAEATGAVDRLHRDFFAESGDYRQVWAVNNERGELFYLADNGSTRPFARRAAGARCAAPYRAVPTHASSRTAARNGDTTSPTA